jgi:ATP-dependent helicase/nuclease subunit A
MALNPEQKAVAEAAPTMPLKVIAGAGTGKTETLKSRFVHLAEESWDRAATILCLTFTEKAAGEMRERIEAALPPNEALLHPPLWIHTFHGFCQRILGEFACQAGLSPGFEVREDIEQELLITRLIQSILHGEYDDEGPLGARTLARLRLSRPDAMLRDVMGFVMKAKSLGWSAEQFEQHTSDRCRRFFEGLPKPEAIADALGDRDLVEARMLRALQTPLGLSGDICPDRSSTTDLRGIYRESAKSVIEPERWQAIRDDEREQEQVVIAATAAAYREYQRLLAENAALDFSDLIIKAIELLRGNESIRLQLEKRFNYVMVDEFQDTTPAQMELLKLITRQKPCTVADCPSAKPGNGRDPNACVLHTNLMIVGDKKQSIYGFLHVRPENVDDLVPCNTPGIRHELSTNYRSAGVVVNLGNRIKEEAEPGDPDLAPHDAAAFIDLQHPDADGAPQPDGCPICRQMVHTCDAPEVQVTGAFIGEDIGAQRKAESRWIADEIAWLSAEQGYRQGDIAVLVQRNSRFADLKNAFNEAGISYVPVGGVGFFAEALVLDTIAYLRIVEDRFDALSLARILTRPPYNLTDRQLYILGSQVLEIPQGEGGEEPAGHSLPRLPMFDALADLAEEPRKVFVGEKAALADELPLEELRTLGALLSDLHAHRFEMPPGAVIEEILRRTDLLRYVAPADDTTAAIALGILRHLAATLESRSIRATLGEFLALLDMYRNAPKSMPTPEIDAGDAVQVMTIHKSKGLEFPVVFLPSVTRSNRESGWVFDENLGLVLTNVRGQRCSKRLVYYALSGEHLQREKGDLRLFYVAATRAMKRLETSYVASAKAKVTGPEGHPYGRFFREDERLQTPEVPETLTKLEGAGARLGLSEPRAIEALPPAESLAQPLQTSFSELRLLDQCPPRFWIKRRWGFPWSAFGSDDEHDTDATAIGTAFHNLVAEFYLKPWSAAEDDAHIGAVADRLKAPDDPRQDCRGHNGDEDGLARLKMLFVTFRSSEWADLRPEAGDVERPVRLGLRLDGATVRLTGKIDVLRRQGGPVIADFKTNARLEEAELGDYALQQYIYARAVAQEMGAQVPEIGGVLVHVTAQGCRDIAVSFDGCEERLNRLLTTAVNVEGAEALPDPGPTPPCDTCHYSDLCPKSTQR